MWHHADYPLIEVGVLELNRNPLNHFAEVEQAAFEPGNLPPGFGASPDDAGCAEPPLRINGDADRYNHRDGNDDYTQAGDLYRLMDNAAKARLIANIVGAMQGVPPEIQTRQIGHFTKADPAFGSGVAAGLNMG